MTIDVTPAFATAPDGVKLAVYEWGNPQGPELVLIHGFAQCHLCWRPQIESELARTFRIVAFDFRGHGASDKPSDPKAYQGPSVWARDIASVLDFKKLKRPVVAGWSMGGRVTRQYLMNFGDARLAGVNFVGSLVIEKLEHRGTAAPRVAVGESLGKLLETTIGFLDACYHIKPSEADFRLALAYNMLLPGPVRLAIGGWATDPAETVAAMNKVKVPVLITQGRKDGVVLPGAAEATAAAIPHAKISWYDNCGHSPFCEDAPRFNAELAAFAKAAASA
ncbi:MAG: alpha/beta hydrolase [Proteobacteria bacterium]|nr:alpha/beta hydrolase [Pseudomonadota bacterium]